MAEKDAQAIVEETDEVQEDNQSSEQQAEAVDDGSIDPDEAELAALRAEVEAEESEGKEPEPEPDQTEADQEGDKPDETEGQAENQGDKQDQQDASASPMIPKPRFDQVVDEKRRLEAQLVYERQQRQRDDANSQKTAEQQSEQTAEQSKADKVAELQKQIDELWDKAEDMQIPQRDAYRQARELERQIEALNAPEPAPQVTQNVNTDLYLHEKTQEVHKDHPFLEQINDLPDADLKWDFLEQQAAADLKQRGTPLNQEDPVSVLQFRRRLGELSDQYGPIWTGASPQNQQPANPSDPPKGGKSDQAAAREKKLNLQDSLPPNLEKVGGSGHQAEVTEADIMVMSEEEIDALPDSVRAKFSV